MKFEYLWVALGGAIGSVGRYWINGLVSEKFGSSFPWGILFINITGSLIIGVAGALAIPEGRMDSQARAFMLQFVMVGICGGYTTFSSFSLQTLNLLQKGEWLGAGGNILLSLMLCLIGVWLGWMIGSSFNSAK